jgi:thioesterase domain-containing protein
MKAAPKHQGGNARETQRSGDTPRFRREHFKPTTAYAPPASELEHQLTALWEAALNVEGLGVEDIFFEVGGESFAAVTLFTEMERFLGRMPPLSILLDYPTIRGLAGFLQEASAAKAGALTIAGPVNPGPVNPGPVNPGLVSPVRAHGKRPLPLFSTHAAHGNVLFVRRLLPHIGAEQRLYAVRARGMREGEAPHQSFADMAADYVAEIRRVQPAGPYLLTGHCIGGLIAFEMAQHLTALGEDVAAIVMIDPEYHPNAVPWLYWREPSALGTRLRLQLLRPAWLVKRHLLRLADRLAGRRVLDRPMETGDNRARQQKVIAGLKAAQRAYRPKRYEGRVVILCSHERRRYLGNKAIGWRSFAPQVELVEIDGSHDQIFYASLPATAEALEKVLAQVQPGGAEKSAERRAAAE